jgi:tRNA threonylcarbamoyladenosine biosynthesis protein TsaE
LSVSKSEKETLKIAQDIAKKVKNGGIICLFGDLGTGKTMLSKGISEALGINKFMVKSPTYTYIRDYPLKNNHVYHIDLYRLEIIDELLLQEIEELMLNKKNILIIEWADRMQDHLPEKRTDVCLEYIDQNSRNITIFNQND